MTYRSGRYYDTCRCGNEKTVQAAQCRSCTSRALARRLHKPAVVKGPRRSPKPAAPRRPTLVVSLLEDTRYSTSDKRRWYPWARDVLRDMKPGDRRLLAMLAVSEPEWAAA